MIPEGKYKPIQDFEDYLIYTTGQVWSLKSNKFLKPFITNKYLKVSLIKDRQRKDKAIHRLVAEHFIPNPNHYETVNHIDENLNNNNVENLEWCSREKNIKTYFKNHPEYTKNGWTKKPIQQFSLNGEFICQYTSINEAARAVQGDRQYISKAALNSKKIAYGYRWKFAES